MTLRASLLVLLLQSLAAASLWDWFEQRNHLFYLRGPWNWAVRRHLPELYKEFNGIDFGHAHLAETLLHTSDAAAIEQARREILTFINSKPSLPPAEPRPLFFSPGERKGRHEVVQGRTKTGN